MRVIVNVVVEIVRDMAVISLAVVYVIFHVAVLKFHHVGAVSMIVQLLTLAGMSAFAHSAILICPSAVHVGEVAFAALSAEIFVPHVPAVTVTAA